MKAEAVDFSRFRSHIPGSVMRVQRTGVLTDRATSSSSSFELFVVSIMQGDVYTLR